MNDAPANSFELAGPQHNEGWPAEPKPPAGWSRNRWLVIILFVFTAHISLIMIFGERKAANPRAVGNVPKLQLANPADKLLELDNPTLFAQPHQHDFAAAAWLKAPEVKPPSFRWTEPPRWLPLSADSLGATFSQLMQTNAFASYPLNFKPALTLSTPVAPIEPLLPQESTMQIEGELAQRQLPAQISLTNWPYADVLSPCVVQVLVSAQGSVVSAVLLPPENGLEPASHYDAADQSALALARSLRFAPSTGLTIGRIIFNWHTVPPEGTTNDED